MVLGEDIGEGAYCWAVLDGHGGDKAALKVAAEVHSDEWCDGVGDYHVRGVGC